MKIFVKASPRSSLSSYETHNSKDKPRQNLATFRSDHLYKKKRIQNSKSGCSKIRQRQIELSKKLLPPRRRASLQKMRAMLCAERQHFLARECPTNSKIVRAGYLPTANYLLLKVTRLAVRQLTHAILKRRQFCRFAERFSMLSARVSTRC